MKTFGWIKRAGIALSVAMIVHLSHSRQNVSAFQVKVFILGGQSNMYGIGHVGPANAKNSLLYAVHKLHKYQFLVNSSGQWKRQKNFRLVQVVSGRGVPIFKNQWDTYWAKHTLADKLPFMRVVFNQWLDVKGHRIIGPEFGIAHELAKVVHGPVLLLKSCNGNRSIGWDLLPPGSPSESYTIKGKTWEYAAYGQDTPMWLKGTPKSRRKKVNWYAGKEYDMDVKFAKYVLAHLNVFYPGATSYKLEGYFFWQGDKDRYNAGYAAHYQKNLAAYIRAVRKSFHAPNMPFVDATLGQDVKGVTKGNDGLVMKGMFAVANPAIYPAFKGNVATVYTHPLSLGGASNGHYNGNAQTYMNVGLAMGKAMDKLLRH